MDSVSSPLSELLRNFAEDDDSISLLSAPPPEGFHHGETGRNKVGRCLLTMFPPDTDAQWLMPENYFFPKTQQIVSIWVAQFEHAPTTGKLHVQAYVEFVNSHRPRFNELKSIIKRVTGSAGNIQTAKRGSSKQRACAVNYCLKPSGRSPNTEPCIWKHNTTSVAFDEALFNNRVPKATKQDEKEAQLNYIESKPMHWSWDQILHETSASKLLLATCSWGPKYHAGRHASQPRRLITNVIVFYGAGGTGKTTLAHKWDTKDDEDFEQRYYKRNPDDGKFWGGGRTAYRGQRIIHLEEFCGQETAANFKEICDLGKSGPSVNIKNSGTDLNHDTVIITSNHHPSTWYRNHCTLDPKQWLPLVRRFTQVWFFPECRPDGSPNIPDADNPPYSIDQTEEFSSRMTYDDACCHASIHWPSSQQPELNLPEPTNYDNFVEYGRTGILP